MFELLLKCHWSLVLRVQLTILKHGWENALVPSRRQTLIWTNATYLSCSLICDTRPQWVKTTQCSTIQFSLLSYFNREISLYDKEYSIRYLESDHLTQISSDNYIIVTAMQHAFSSRQGGLWVCGRVWSYITPPRILDSRGAIAKIIQIIERINVILLGQIPAASGQCVKEAVLVSQIDYVLQSETNYDIMILDISKEFTVCINEYTNYWFYFW